ncbi:MAG: hypothetical protein AAF202_06065, partial [Pseudomonadota bacterium]
MKILLTGFEPFDGRVTNSSWQMLSRIATESFAVEKLEIPVSYEGAWASISGRANDFDAIVSVGESGKAKCLEFEWFAANIQDSSLPDNSGEVLRHESISSEDVVGLRSLRDSLALREFFKQHPEWAMSYSAGTYVCNRLFF